MSPNANEYILYFNHFIPKFHILDLLIVRDRIELHRFGLHKIFQHIRNFCYRVGIKIIYGFVDKQDRGVDVARNRKHPHDFQNHPLTSAQAFDVPFSFLIKNLRQQFQLIGSTFMQREGNLILDDLCEIGIDDIAQHRQMVLQNQE